MNKKECKYAEYDMEGKHCKLTPLSNCWFLKEGEKIGKPDECECPDYEPENNTKETEEEPNVHSGITLDLEKISFHELCNLRDMVDEELSSRRNEQDRIVEDFRTAIEDLIDSGVKVYYQRSNEFPVKSFSDFSIYYTN